MAPGATTPGMTSQDLGPSYDIGLGGKTGCELDEERQRNAAYEYLCHLEEAKNWMASCIGEENLPPVTELEEGLRNGVLLAKLAHFFAPGHVPLKKIFDPDMKKYGESGLHFRHTDNINYFLRACQHLGLPEIFTPETTDIYDAKNMPRVIFCLHALSLFLFKCGLAPQIQDLYGKATFTQEEISSMQKALSEYGLPMPQFKRINGILADEIPDSDAALHAAIIAINGALDSGNFEAFKAALTASSAGIIHVKSESFKHYLLVLVSAKKEKSNSSSSSSGDAYDELLTRNEIQSHIDKVNLLVNLEEVENAVRRRDGKSLVICLKNLDLGLKVENEASSLYMEFLKHAVLSLGSEDVLKIETIKAAVREANDRCNGNNNEKSSTDVTGAKISLNEALKTGDDYDLTLKCLRALSLPVKSFARKLYHEELKYVLNEGGSDLSNASLLPLINFLNAIADTNEALKNNKSADVWTALTSRIASIEDLNSKYKNEYFNTLKSTLESKKSPLCLLTHSEIQDIVDVVNKASHEDYVLLCAIEKVNEAVQEGNRKSLYEALKNPILKIGTLEEKDISHTLLILEELRGNQSLLESEECEFWIDHILEAAQCTRLHAQEAQNAGFALSIVNMAVLQSDCHHTAQTLNHPSLGLEEYLGEDNYEAYQQVLEATIQNKNPDGGPWVHHVLTDNEHSVYLNLQDHIYSWDPPATVVRDSRYLSSADIISCLESVNRFGENDRLILRLQARIRGYLVRCKLFSMLQHYYDNEHLVILTQASVKGYLTRKKIREILRIKRKKRVSSIKSLHYYQDLLPYILTIQRAWRKRKQALDLRALTKVDPEGNVPLSVVRKYLYLLDHSHEDFDQEIGLQSIKGELSKIIRYNQNLEKNLDVMDIKIGLLVKNRITVDEVVAHSKTLTGAKRSTVSLHSGSEEAPQTTTHVRGLKALKKESREKLDAYQNLFYLLQTHPKYLAKLIFAMPQVKTNKFMESVILSLYNYGTNSREEYMLLKLFKTALEEEIFAKVDKLGDIVSGQPMVIKMIVGFYRSAGKGSNSLREMLGPIILRVLEDKNLSMNTNPVDIYKQWINQVEFETGETVGLPYDVTPQEALAHDEVKKRLSRSITKLKQVTTMFLATIMKAKNKIPYGMLYIAKILYKALMKKFPEAPLKELLKIVGNLLYYRFINPAIVAPDAFDVVDLPQDTVLNSEQRRNLASVAKVLQFAASKKGYGDESAHLACLNPYIVEYHEKFKKFFQSCVEEVKDPEDEFNMDQYSEAILIAKPVIFISLQEIVDTHQLLLDFIYSIAPDQGDPLHELLKDLGDSPSLCSLVGVASSSSNMSLASVASSEVCLTLTNKFEFSTADKSNSQELFIKTKHLILSILPCTKEGNLIGCLKSYTTPEQEDIYWDHIRLKERQDKEARKKKSLLESTGDPFINDEGRLPLEDCKRQILKNLRVLEMAGFVTAKNGCKSLITSIIKDIVNRRQYRLRRQKEIFRLTKTLKSLELKKQFHEDQVDYYNEYLKQCLRNLQVNKRKVHFQTPGPKSSVRINEQGKMKSRLTLKYSASRLFEKGILHSIDGLPANQFKNVLFEIVPTQNDGVFEIHAKFMGVRLEHVDVDIQDLLQYQYEGVSVMNMFGKAKINVNLLLHFLNSKFYGRKK